MSISVTSSCALNIVTGYRQCWRPEALFLFRGLHHVLLVWLPQYTLVNKYQCFAESFVWNVDIHIPKYARSHPRTLQTLVLAAVRNWYLTRVLSVLALMLVLVEVINYCSVNRLGLDTLGQMGLEWSTAIGIEGAYSITPLIRTLVIRIANYPYQLGPSGKHFLTVILLLLFVA
jgi:hypothetical protein